MAICKACKSEINDQALRCPHCRTLTTAGEHKRLLPAVGVILLILILLFFVFAVTR